MFTIDGIEWDVPCRIERMAEITASEISGLLLDKTYFNDVLGTYLRYNISIAVPIGMEEDYAELYEILTDPVDAHTFILPYNQTEVTITARVETVSDKYYRVENGNKIWRGTKFTAIAIHPTKSIELEEAVARGISPIPDVQNPEIGDVYEFTENGWVPVEEDEGE